MAMYEMHPKNTLRNVVLLVISLAVIIGVVVFTYDFSDNAGDEVARGNESSPGQTEGSAPYPQDYNSGYESENGSEPDPENTQNEERSEPHPDDEWRLILVSPASPIGYGFTPPQLETIREHHQVDSRIAPNLRQMIADAELEGVILLVTSAYRPATRQLELHNRQIERFLNYGHSEEEAIAVASTIVLPPGTSEHQTGLAVDIVTPDYQVLDEGFADTPAGRWLAANSWRYGFILRYPQNSQEITGVIYEPWHFRYVGREHARAIFEGGYILEQYLIAIGR